MSSQELVTHVAAAAGIGLVAATAGYMLGCRSLKPAKRNKTGRSEDPEDVYIRQHSLRLHPAQEKLIKITLEHPHCRMMGSADEIQFLCNLVKTIGAKKTLDIGVYTGYSAMSVAMALPDDGRVVACDISEDFANVGKPVWKEAGVYDKIDLRIAPAVETLESFIKNGEEGTYDFAFIDADKENYWTYFELALKLIRKRGIIAIDNVLWGGSVFQPDIKMQHTSTIQEFNRRLKNDQRVDISMLACGDGTTLAFKK